MNRFLSLMFAGAFAAALGLATPALAQQGGFPPPNGVTIDLNKKAAAMAMPFVTNAAGDTASTVLITNTKTDGPVRLWFQVISGDDGAAAAIPAPVPPAQVDINDTTINDFWTKFDFGCNMTAGETHQFTFTPLGPDNSILTYECSDLDAVPNGGGDPAKLNRKRAQALVAHMGVLWVYQIDAAGQTIGGDILEGKTIVTSFVGAMGPYAYELAATTYQGLAGLDGDTNWRFDGNEFPNHAATLTTSFIAPSPLVGQPGPDANPNLFVEAYLLVWTLDGTLSTGLGMPNGVPNPTMNINYYNDDEVVRSTGVAFKCFAFVELARIQNGVLTDFQLGSPAGHLDIKSAQVTPLDTAHEAAWGAGDNLRRFPIDGHLVQIVRPGGQIATVHEPAAVGVGLNPAPGVLTTGAAALPGMPASMAWASKLTMSNVALTPSPGDRPTLSVGF